MDFNPRHFDSRDDDRLAGPDAYDDQHRDDEARSLGRGPSASRASDDDERGSDARDDARWTDRERDPREQTITPREPFTRDLDLPRGPDRELVHDRNREYTLRGSETRTLARVGAFRVVSSRDLRDNHDRPLDPRSSDLRHLREQGLVETVRVAGSREYAVGLTREGLSLLERHRDRDRDQDGGQTFWSGVKRERELEHDIQVYRAYEREAARLEAQGARVDRVVLDHELKREYQQWLHAHDGQRDDYDGHPDREPHEIEEWAREYDLPYFDEQVHFPDVRIEYQDADDRWEHLDVEVVTVHYRGAHGGAVARSGFKCYGGSSARVGSRAHLDGLAEEMLQ
jgi:hypothetical protein